MPFVLRPAAACLRELVRVGAQRAQVLPDLGLLSRPPLLRPVDEPLDPSLELLGVDRGDHALALQLRDLPEDPLADAGDVGDVGAGGRCRGPSIWARPWSAGRARTAPDPALGSGLLRRPPRHRVGGRHHLGDGLQALRQPGASRRHRRIVALARLDILGPPPPPPRPPPPAPAPWRWMARPPIGRGPGEALQARKSPRSCGGFSSLRGVRLSAPRARLGARPEPTVADSSGRGRRTAHAPGSTGARATCFAAPPRGAGDAAVRDGAALSWDEAVAYGLERARRSSDRRPSRSSPPGHRGGARPAGLPSARG